jgi:hypothetical protein
MLAGHHPSASKTWLGAQRNLINRMLPSSTFPTRSDSLQQRCGFNQADNR